MTTGKDNEQRSSKASPAPDCKSCQTRAKRGLEGQCPACAKERTLSERRSGSDPTSREWLEGENVGLRRDLEAAQVLNRHLVEENEKLRSSAATEPCSACERLRSLAHEVGLALNDANEEVIRLRDLLNKGVPAATVTACRACKYASPELTDEGLCVDAIRCSSREAKILASGGWRRTSGVPAWRATETAPCARVPVADVCPVTGDVVDNSAEPHCPDCERATSEASHDGAFYSEHVLGYAPDGTPTPELLRPELRTGEDQAKRCRADTTFRDDEHKSYQCVLPSGHEGSHEGGTTVEWTDATTRPRIVPDTPDEKFMAAVATYVDEWRDGDDAWHGAGHIASMVSEQRRESPKPAPVAEPCFDCKAAGMPEHFRDIGHTEVCAYPEHDWKRPKAGPKAGAEREPVVWANEASPFTGAEVQALLDENQRLRNALGEVCELGDRCEECEPHGAPFATHVTESPVTGVPVFLCDEHADETRAAYRKAESKGCGKQPEVEEHEQELAVTIAREALAALSVSVTPRETP